MTVTRTETDRPLLEQLWHDLRGAAAAPTSVTFAGPSHTLPSVFDVTTLAAGSVAAADLAIAELHATRTGDPLLPVTVDRRQVAAAFRSERYLRPVGWELPAIWDPIAGDYPTADGWIRLHTNYTYHRDAAIDVLEVPAEREAVARAVTRWTGDDLEAAVVAAGGCAAALRTLDEWQAHPQGRAVRAEPIVACRVADGPAPASSPRWLHTRPAAPLAGIRVLDLTRVIAGPVCTRVLAAYGAEVLRLDPPGFEEVGALLAETTAGKSRTALDLTATDDRATFERLITEADVIVHGYRSDALAALGFATEQLWAINPGLVITTHDAYGWAGPWATRRGFDSLVQMSCGIAARGQEVAAADRPVPLPAQALDHGTGYLLAAATCRSLVELAIGAGATENRLSLARTAQLLLDLGEPEAGAAADFTPVDAEPWLEDADTAFGPVRRVPAPGRIGTIEPAWTIPAGPLGVDQPRWAP